MTAAPKFTPGLKSLSGKRGKADPLLTGRRPLSAEEETSICTQQTHRSTGPSTQGKNRGDNVGKDPLPAGAGSNLRRLFEPGKTKVEERIWVRRMSQYERRRRSNALPGSLRGCPHCGNSAMRQRGSRTRWLPGRAAFEALTSAWPVSLFLVSSSRVNRPGEGCTQASASASAYTGRPDPPCRARQPGSGNPTVRDDNGGFGNRGRSVVWNPVSSSLRARFYPNGWG